MTGTHWVYGYNCGTTPGSTYSIVTANMQDCLNKMVTANGDDLGLPPQALGGPAAYPISTVSFHNSENAISLTASGSTFTSAGATPANGSQIVLGGQATYSSVPNPLNSGVPYYVVNASGSTFQLSATSGGTPITLTSAGAYGFLYLPWPITQPTSVIHSTAAPNQLPPVGVRLGPDALAQYYPYMPNLQAIDPLNGATSMSYLQLNPLTENIAFENIRFSVDPTVATSTNVTDPVAFKSPIVMGSGNYATSGITWDQCAFDPGPAPTRAQAIQTRRQQRCHRQLVRVSGFLATPLSADCQNVPFVHQQCGDVSCIHVELRWTQRDKVQLPERGRHCVSHERHCFRKHLRLG